MSDKSLEEMFVSTILKESAGKLQEVVAERITNIQDELTGKIDKLQSKYDSKIALLDEEISNAPITVNLGTVSKPKNRLVHKQFNTVLNILKSTKRITKNIMLVGPAGSGKSSLCGQVAEALNVKFYPMSVGLQTTKSDLIGFINARGEYMSTPLREAYENGGLVLLDEFDATHAGVVTILNSMLANDFCSFPDKIVYKHQDFICLVACNTYGKGGSIDYVGRNRLDGATLDRFLCVNVDYDKTLENKLTSNKDWVKVIRKMRKNIKEHGLKVIVSPRASMQGADLLEAGFKIEDVLEMVIFKGVSEDIKGKLIKGIDFGVFNGDDLEPQVDDVRLTIDGRQVSVEPLPSMTIKDRDIKCIIDFDSRTYDLSNIKSDVNIIKDQDWNGHHNIYLSSGSDWSTGCSGPDIFMNFGTGTLGGGDYVNAFAKPFIADLEKFSDSIKIDNGQDMSLKVVYGGRVWTFDIG